MRLLIVTSSLPYPPASGGAIRVYGIIHGLSTAGHDVHVLCFADKAIATPLDDVATVHHIIPPTRSLPQRLKTLFLSSQPDIATRFWSAELAQHIHDLHQSQPFDGIQFEGIEMACFLPVCRTLSPKPKLIFDTFNAEAELQKVIFQIDRQKPQRILHAIYSWIQSRRITYYEGNLCRLSDAVIAVSEEDATILRRYRKDNQTTVVSSGIMVDDYTNDPTVINLEPNTLVFTGKMDYRPNVDAMLWFCEKILPQLPNTQLVIVGQKPTESIRALTEKYPVKITGWVGRVTPYLRGATVYIAPLRMGSGTRLKILEALACGCAIVATSLAATGLHHDVLDVIKIADTPEAFAQEIKALLNDADRRQTLQAQATQQVRQHYDWRVLIPRLLSVYKDLDLG